MMPFLLLIFQIHFLSDGLTYDEHCMQTSWWRTMMNVIFTCQITWIHAGKIWRTYSTNATVQNGTIEKRMRCFIFAGLYGVCDVVWCVDFLGVISHICHSILVIGSSKNCEDFPVQISALRPNCGNL